MTQNTESPRRQTLAEKRAEALRENLKKRKALQNARSRTEKDKNDKDLR